jgi:hypothetical protein
LSRLDGRFRRRWEDHFIASPKLPHPLCSTPHLASFQLHGARSIKKKRSQTSLLVNTNIKGANAIVKVSVDFSSSAVPSSPGANLTSNSLTMRAMTLRSSIRANCFPTHEYGPGDVNFNLPNTLEQSKHGTHRLKMAQKRLYREPFPVSPPSARV